MPVEAVVPALGGIVEQALIASTRGGDDLFERLAFEIGALDRSIGLVDIGLVVLAMVKAERFGRNGRRQRVGGIGKRDQLESHDWVCSCESELKVLPA